MKHDYFIDDLGQPDGWFKAHRYRYSCLRCGWAFYVGSRGKISAVDKADKPLPEPDNAHRVGSFVDGPCTPIAAAPPAPRLRAISKPPVKTRRPAVLRRADGVAQIVSYR